MRNIILVMKHEIASTIGKPVFWLTTFVLPVTIMVLSLGAQFLSVRAFQDEPDIFDSENNGEKTQKIGYVDHADIIHSLPDGIPADRIIEFPDIATAQRTMDAGTLSHYYIIDANFIQTGDLTVIAKEFSPLGDIRSMNLFQTIINYNLTGDISLARLISDPIQEVESYALDADASAGIEQEDSATRFIVGFGILFILFMILTMTSGFMLRSVSQEKENRTVEVLLVSLKAKELMIGKIVGLGAVALLQMAVWFGGSSVILQKDNPLINSLGITLTQSVSLPKGFVIWAILYLILGYLLYASLLGAIGALAPNSRETGQFTFIALLPLMIPIWMNTVFFNAPNGELATILSLFPLTAPTSMLPRLAIGGVPTWQPIISIIGLTLATYGCVLLAARFFRADTLLSSLSLNWKRLRNEMVNGYKK